MRVSKGPISNLSWVSTYQLKASALLSTFPFPSIHQEATLLKLRLNRTLQTRRLSRTSPTSLNLPILTNQELLKIPLNPLQAHETGFLVLHPRPHGLFGSIRFAVHFDFAEDFVRHFVAEHAEVLDFFVGARVLAAELVAGEGEDFEVFVGGFEVCGGQDVSCVVRTR
jgi:hypothetical protein